MSNLLVFPRSPVPDQAFARAASRLAGAAAIVTWQEGGAAGGLLIRAVSLLSTRPARVLFGVAKDDPAHDALLRADLCALNLLSEADEDEAERFDDARAAPRRFSPDRWRIEADQPPRLLGGAGCLAGAVDHRIDAGSHSLFVVRVESAEANGRAPLVSFDHGFRRLEQSAAAGGQAGAASA